MPDHTGGRTGDNEAHEHVESKGRSLRLCQELEHHAYPTIAIWVEKHNRYAVWEAAMYERFLNEPVPATIGRGKQLNAGSRRFTCDCPFAPWFASSTPISFAWDSSTAGRAWSSALCWRSMTSWPGRMSMNNTSRKARVDFLPELTP